MYNQTIIVGRITKDPDLRKSESNKSVIEFNLATSSGYNSEKVEYISCEAWEGKADYLHSKAGKGDMILLVGYLKNRFVNDKKDKTVVVANHVEILSKKKVTTEEDYGIERRQGEQMGLWSSNT